MEMASTFFGGFGGPNSPPRSHSSRPPSRNSHFISAGILFQTFFRKAAGPGADACMAAQTKTNVEERMDVWERGLIRDRLSRHDDPVAIVRALFRTKPVADMLVR